MNALPLISIEPPDGRPPFVFASDVSSFDDKGLFGLNLALSLATHPRFSPVAATRFAPTDLVLDPLREHLMQRVGTLSADLWNAMAALPQPDARINAPLLVALGAGLATPSELFLTGQPPVGIAFAECVTLSEAAHRRAEGFALIIAGSTWNEGMLRANGIAATTTVMHGVDTSLFHPAPATGHYRDRFVVFAGGTLTASNGQDLVVKAFRSFRQRHPEALLLTAWNTPWHEHTDFPGPAMVPAAPDSGGWVDTAAWAIANGVPAHSLIALGRVPNIAMPHIIREANVALFPNRCEAGTNPMAMACMACGVPTILSANTGHLDLLRRDDVAYRLTRQQPDTRPEWHGSDVDEIVETLEAVWLDREAASATGQRGAAFIAPMTWPRQTELLLRAIDPLLP